MPNARSATAADSSLLRPQARQVLLGPYPSRQPAGALAPHFQFLRAAIYEISTRIPTVVYAAPLFFDGGHLPRVRHPEGHAVAVFRGPLPTYSGRSRQGPVDRPPLRSAPAPLGYRHLRRVAALRVLREGRLPARLPGSQCLRRVAALRLHREGDFQARQPERRTPPTLFFTPESSSFFTLASHLRSHDRGKDFVPIELLDIESLVSPLGALRPASSPRRGLPTPRKQPQRTEWGNAM